MKRIIATLFAVSVSMLSFAGSPCHGTMNASNTSSNRIVISGQITNHSDKTITDVEITMLYGDGKGPALKHHNKSRANLRPGQSQSFSLTFDKWVNYKEAYYCSVTRVWFSDGTVQSIGTLEKNGLVAYL